MYRCLLEIETSIINTKPPSYTKKLSKVEMFNDDNDHAIKDLYKTSKCFNDITPSLDNN